MWRALQGCAGTVTRRPNVWAGCCSQVSVRLEFGSRAYVSGLLIGTRAVAILGLRSLRGLISGEVILDHLGRQTLGAFLSVPSVSAFANSFERRRFQTARRISSFVEPRPVAQDAPGHLSQLVGERDGELVLMHALRRSRQLGAEVEGLSNLCSENSAAA